MNVIQGSPLPESEQTGPSSAYPGMGGGYGPGGYGPGDYGSGGYGSGGYGPGRRRPRRRRLAFGAAGVALAVAAGVGSYEAVQGGTPAGGATTSADTTLSTSQIAAQVSPGLVDINTTLGDQNATAAGTGLVLTPTGEVLTNNHVIAGATSITVTDVGNGQTYKATVVGYDQSKDLAVLQLQGASGLKTVSLGNSSTVAAGQKVVAIGNAGGQGGTPSVVTGSVTAVGQTITASDQGSGTSEQLSGMIETNAPIQPGDSGGPLVNSAGQVVGIDTAASSSTGVPSAQPQAFAPGQSPSPAQGQTQTQAFSIPINEAVSVAAQIEAGTSSSTVHLGATAFLGVEIASTGAGPGSGYGGYGGYGGFGGTGGTGGTGTSGVTVAGTLSGSPAAQAGLAAGDTITSLGGQPVTSQSQIQSILGTYHPGDKISVSWVDSYGQAHTATIVLATGPAA
jgi:S1-C subfamily serine protease